VLVEYVMVVTVDVVIEVSSKTMHGLNFLRAKMLCQNYTALCDPFYDVNIFRFQKCSMKIGKNY
jgi:hypothetical protein